MNFPISAQANSETAEPHFGHVLKLYSHMPAFAGHTFQGLNWPCLVDCFGVMTTDGVGYRVEQERDGDIFPREDVWKKG